MDVIIILGHNNDQGEVIIKSTHLDRAFNQTKMARTLQLAGAKAIEAHSITAFLGMEFRSANEKRGSIHWERNFSSLETGATQALLLLARLLRIPRIPSH